MFFHFLKQRLALFLLFVLSASVMAAPESSLQNIQERGFIRIGVFVGTRGFGHADSEGNRTGIDIDIARYLVKEMFGDESKVEFINTLGVNRAAYLKAGAVDVVIANYSDTKRRRKAVDFAEPYVRSRMGVVGLPSLNIKNFNDLQGKMIILFKGSAAEQYLEEHYPQLELSRFNSTTKAYNMFKSTPNAVLVNDNLILYRWMKDNPGYEMKLLFGDPVYSAPAVDKGNAELLQWINVAMKKMKAEGQLKTYYHRNLAKIYVSGVTPEEVLAE